MLQHSRALGAGSRLAHGHVSTARCAAAAAEPATPPERGVLILPGLANNTADYLGLAAHLEQRGLASKVVQVGRADWGRNGAALTDPNWW
jgi:NAD(P)H-hydrate repair Nnr-like enzyme with NAD(P)H-hydrate epimerase domain